MLGVLEKFTSITLSHSCIFCFLIIKNSFNYIAWK